MCLQEWLLTNMEGNEINTYLDILIKQLLENFNELLMFSSSSRLKLNNIKLYTMLQDVDIDEVSNFFNTSLKNKLQYKLSVIFYLFIFQESIEGSGFVDPNTNYG